MVGIELYRVTVSQLATNCYILKQKRTRNALVIDPGADYGKIKEKLDHLRNTFGDDQITLEDVHDLFRFKINLSSIEDCYRAKKAFESYIAEGDNELFFGEPFYVKDYIQKPAFNGYQAIHARYYIKSINSENIGFNILRLDIINTIGGRV